MLTALDLFAGTGWGVACQRLGIEEHGVEIMPEAVATRDAAGMSTVFRDVWDGLEDRRSPEAERGLELWLDAGGSASDYRTILIASPPCQTFSMAGKGAGRRALDDVLRLIPAAADPSVDLRSAGAGLDDRTALVLTPLAYVARFRPTFVALEQVPTVLPVWEAIADVLRSEFGYSVAVGVLNAEQYGVPQTRRRAILVARRDGIEASLPTPTHSRYYSRDPQRLDEGVLPWVSMAEALGWGLTARPSPTITGGGVETGGAEPIAKLARYVTRPDWAFRRPATTIAGDSRVWPPGHKVNASDIARLGEDAARERYGDRAGSQAVRLEPEEAAVLQTFPSWPFERPAPTVVGTRRSEGGMLIGRQLDDSSRRDRGGRQTSVGLRPGMLPGVRVSEAEGSALQSFPQPFPFQGSKSKRFLQIGNAVPPLLAEHILRTFL